MSYTQFLVNSVDFFPTKMIKKGNDYYITDVIAEDVSFISSQRSEIGSIISSEKFNEFLEKLKSENR